MFIGSVVGLQERLDSLPQLGIAHALAIQDRSAVHNVVMVCSFQENGLHTLRVKRHGKLLRSGTACRFDSSDLRANQAGTAVGASAADSWIWAVA